MTIGEKILKFINDNYGSQKIFSESNDIYYVGLNRYITNKVQPGIEILTKFQDAGMSIDWLLTGLGSMYAKNLKGKELKERKEEEDLKKIENPFDRIKIWIKEHYNSLENFSVMMNYNLDEIVNILYFNMVPDTDFITVLFNAGCNIGWLSTGEGSKYANNPIGQILKFKHEDIANTEDVLKLVSHHVKIEDIQD